MQRALIIGLAAVTLWLGCGVDEEPMRPRMEQKERVRLEDLTPQELEAQTASQAANAPRVFERADGRDGDAEADYAACRRAKLGDEKFLRANSLQRAIMLVNCMREKGWEVKPGAERTLEREAS